MRLYPRLGEKQRERNVKEGGGEEREKERSTFIEARGGGGRRETGDADSMKCAVKGQVFGTLLD